jgi:RNA polymerase sigma-70 factor (ECF subfamily)
MTDELDRQIVDNMLAGEEQAFRQVLDHHLGPISNYVKRMISNSAEAEDIVQETFIRLWSLRSNYDPERARLTTWLHRIAHNLCIDSHRKNNRDSGDRELKSVIDEKTTPEVNHINASMSELVKHALMKLPERQRSAIVMCHYQGLSNKDAAAILDVSVDALESLLRRGRKTLKDALQG